MKKFILALMLGLSACYRITLPGPDGVLHTVTPYAGTQLIRVFNRCSSQLRVIGYEHMVDIPYGGSAMVLLPVTLGQDRNQPQDVVFDAHEGNREIGTRRVQLTADYQSVVTRRQLVVGGRDADVWIDGACGY